MILDGVDHMKLGADPTDPESKAADEDEESSSEDEGKPEEKKKEVKKPPKKEEEEMPVIYSCPICTFENPISVPQCEMCGSERPPMEQIIADFRRANMPPPEEKKEEGGESAPAKSPTQLILAEMAQDCRRIFSRLERKAYKLKLQEIEDEKKKQAAEQQPKAEDKKEEKKAEEA